MNDDGSMRRGDALLAFSRNHGYPMLTIAELVAFRREQEALTA
jgi:3,4-dihydroxy-2-butanone 4-phosphate synthase